jgi:uncharacterized coiled-coil protein SlyX
MSKAAVDANRIKELEAQVAELELTVDAQSQVIVNQLNAELALRREMTAMRASLNGGQSLPAPSSEAE